MTVIGQPVALCFLELARNVSGLLFEHTDRCPSCDFVVYIDLVLCWLMFGVILSCVYFLDFIWTIFVPNYCNLKYKKKNGRNICIKIVPPTKYKTSYLYIANNLM